MTYFICYAGLNTPLILSSLALDLKAEGVISLIRSYLNSSHQEWLYGKKDSQVSEFK